MGPRIGAAPDVSWIIFLVKIPFKNTLSITASLGSSFFINLAQLKVLTSALSPSDVGLYFAAAGVSLILGSFFMWGFPMVFSRYIPKFETEDRRDKVEALFWVNIITFLLPAAATYLVVRLMAVRLGASALATVLPAAFVSHVPLFVASAAASYFAGARRMHLTAVFNVLPLAVHVTLLYAYRDTLTVVGAFHLLTLAATPVVIIAILAIRPHFHVARHLWREIDHFWGFAILTSLLAPFILYVDRVIIAGLLPLEGLALYMIARKIENAIRRVLTIPLYVMAPELSYHSDAASEMGSVAAIFRSFRQVYLILGVAMCAAVGWFGRDIIHLLSTEAYTGAYPLLLILLAAVVAGCLYAPYTLLARSLGRMDLYFYSDLVWVVSYLPLCIFLIRHVGLAGVPWAAFSASCVTLLFVWVHVRPKLQR